MRPTSTIALWNIASPDGEVRWATGPVLDGPQELLPDEFSLGGWLGASADAGAFEEAEGEREPVPDGSSWLAPVENQEVWAAGVTFERSKFARLEESQDSDHYDRIYVAKRPELFFKAGPGRVRGPGEPIGIRADSDWNVPEPELALYITAHGRIAGYAIGNDVSSRSIEGENPLYLPQAKVYTGSCAVGPCLVPVDQAPPLEEVTISLVIERSGSRVFDASLSMSEMRRTPEELAAWLFAAQDFPTGVILLTGTSIVPEGSFTLRQGDTVIIEATGLGRLVNTVESVGLTSVTGGLGGH